MFSHRPVLLEEVVAALSPKPGSVILDATVGGGGHAERLAEAGARIIGLDVDPEAIAAARERLRRFGDQVTIGRANFADAREFLGVAGIAGVDGLVADLGVSSRQFDEPRRGFSFSNDGPLDMRMSAEGETARQLIDRSDEEALAGILRDFGEERFARRIARAIKRAGPAPDSTSALAGLVSSAIPRKAWPRTIHPATRTFQALRIAVNAELSSLDRLLDALPSLLVKGGRAAIISFHSLEDRRVKNAFRDLAGRCRCPPKLPVCVCNAGAGFSVVTRKAIVAGETEVRENPRARSARLRVAQRDR
jgi:16S rRNA (cytosine1402-N4)-methyltransferase